MFYFCEKCSWLTPAVAFIFLFFKQATVRLSGHLLHSPKNKLCGHLRRSARFEAICPI